MEFAKVILEFVTQGGHASVIAILIGVIAALLWERRVLAKLLTDTTQKVYDAKDNESRSIREIIDRYHKGNLDLVQALNEIKIVLITLQNTKK